MRHLHAGHADGGVGAAGTRSARPTPDAVEDALGGVLCRCTGYAQDHRGGVRCASDAVPAPARHARGRARRSARRSSGSTACPRSTGAESFGADDWPDGRAGGARDPLAPSCAPRFGFGDLDAWAADRRASRRSSPPPTFPARTASASSRPSPTSRRWPRARRGSAGEAVALVAGEAAAMAISTSPDFPVDLGAAGRRDPIPTAAAAAGARPVHDGAARQRADRAAAWCSGDAEAALAAAAHVAEVDGRDRLCRTRLYRAGGRRRLDGRRHAGDPAPAPRRRSWIATMSRRVLGLPPERVRIMPTATGGGFGSKLDVSLQPLIGLVALKTGRPCRMVYTRTELMQSTTKRHPARMSAPDRRRCRRAAIAGMAFDGDFNTGAYASWGPTVANRVPVHASGPYRTPNYRAETRARCTPTARSAGAFRGFGVPQAAVVQETLYDDLALALRDRPAGLPPAQRAAARARPRSAARRCEGVGIGACLDALAAALGRGAGRGGGVQRGARRRQARRSAWRRCWYGCGNTALPNPSTVRVGITARRPADAASGRDRYRPGLQHRDHADLRRCAGRAAGRCSS